MKSFTHDIWWKCVIVILSFLLALQLLFNRHVQQISIYTYRVMQDYYQHNLDNVSRYFFVDSTLYTNDNSSLYENDLGGKFFELTTKFQESMERCSANLTHVFIQDNESLTHVTPGGMWTPQYCRPWTKVALIIPFRWREPHLKHFVPYMHSFLQSQCFAYQIFVIEQYANETFNRAKLMNVGFVEARKIYNFDCYIFHDVDLLPLDNYLLYNCSHNGPIHMASAIDKWGYNMPYGGYFGGVCGFTEDQLKKINGFSNRFYGWGGEDDEIAARIGFSGQGIQRYPTHIGRYHMFRHGKDNGNDANPQRVQFIGEAHANWKDDGLSNLYYKVVKIKKYSRYTKILADIKEKKVSTTTTTTTTTTSTASKSSLTSGVILTAISSIRTSESAHKDQTADYTPRTRSTAR